MLKKRGKNRIKKLVDSKIADRLKIVYMDIFFLSLLLSLFYTVAKDSFQLSNSYYGLIYLITIIIALISYTSYHKIDRIKKNGYEKGSSTATYKIIWHRIVEHRKNVKHEKEEKEYKKKLKNNVKKHGLKINPKLVYSILAIVALFLSLVSIVYSTWLLLLLFIVTMIFSLFSLKKLIKKEPSKKSRNIKKLINSKKWYETDIDKLLQVINQNKTIKLSEVASGFNISKEKAEMWGNMLEKHSLIKLYYPAIGELMFIDNNVKIANPNARIIFKYFLVMLSIVLLFVLLLVIKIYLL